jgi:hypothetical protein
VCVNFKNLVRIPRKLVLKDAVAATAVLSHMSFAEESQH